MLGEAIREIGGYFELEHFDGAEYHQGAIALNCARNCLVYLIEARHIESILIPSYICSSVAVAARKAGARVIDYDITAGFLPSYESMRLADDSYLYLVDYYGQLTDEDIRRAALWCSGRLIVDEVQNFFRLPLEGIDTLYCCRKYFGVPDGAYLYTSARLERELERDESRGRMAHLLGRAERPASEFYSYYTSNDKSFADEPVKLMSTITHSLLRAINYEAIKLQRTKNYLALDSALGSLNQLSPRAPEGAYMYPLLIDNAAPIRRDLQRNRLYIPTLWPGCLKLNGITGRYSRDILPIPVDQRYSTNDMAYIIELLGEHLATRDGNA